MRLSRAGLYLPTGVRDGRRVAGPDEDPFTLVAAALERAVEGSVRRAGPIRVEWLGGDGGDLDWAIPVLLGTSAEVVHYPRSDSALRAACERAAQEDDRSSIVVGGELFPGSSAVPRTSPHARAVHDGGFAIAFAPEGPLGASEVLEAVPPDPSLIRAAMELHRKLADRVPPSTWRGDWEEGALPSRPVDPEPVTLPDRLRSVSEGAYVPRPRYIENLPSRWRFVAERCGACRTYTFPTRGRCRTCGRTQGLEAQELPRDGGFVVATTTIGRGGQPTEFDPVVEAFGPYQVVLAELAPGTRVPLQVTDAAPGEIRIGDRVDSRLRRLYAMEGEWRYGRKAVPARPPPSLRS